MTDKTARIMYSKAFLSFIIRFYHATNIFVRYDCITGSKVADSYFLMIIRPVLFQYKHLLYFAEQTSISGAN